jgi:uncharacterized protein YijF (DUF1287 family)
MPVLSKRGAETDMVIRWHKCGQQIDLTKAVKLDNIEYMSKPL